MPNVDVLYQAEVNAQYLGEGMAKAIYFLRAYAPFFEHVGDAIARSVTAALTTTVTNVKTTAGNVYCVRVTSPAAAAADGFVQMFNSTAANTTLGTTAPTEIFRSVATRTRIYLIVPGDDDNDLFSTAISIAATTTAGGATAIATASLPDVEVIYA